MSEHYAVINDLSNSPRDRAVLEVAGDVAGEVTFYVYAAGGAGAPNPAPIGPPSCFVSSASSGTPNLFTASGGGTALVRAVYALGPSTAVLRQTSTAGKIVLEVPPFDPAHGRAFSFPLGDIGRGAYALVGNPNAMPASLSVRLGASSAPATAAGIVPAWGAIAVPLTSGNTQVRLESDVPVVVQLAADTGKVDETWVPPVD